MACGRCVRNRSTVVNEGSTSFEHLSTRLNEETPVEIIDRSHLALNSYFADLNKYETSVGRTYPGPGQKKRYKLMKPDACSVRARRFKKGKRVFVPVLV